MRGLRFRRSGSSGIPGVLTTPTCCCYWKIRLPVPLHRSPTPLSRLMEILFCGAGALMGVSAWLICSWPKIRLTAFYLAMPGLFFFAFDALLAVLIGYRYILGGHGKEVNPGHTELSNSDVPIIVPVLVRNSNDVLAVESLLEACSYGPFQLPNPIWIVVDFRDAKDEHHSDDTLLKGLLTRAVDISTNCRELSNRAPAGLLVRPRLWNRHELKWMGYERKRGKIEESLRYLNGEDHNFEIVRESAKTHCKHAFVMDLDSRIKLKDLAALHAAFDRARELTEPNRRPALMAPIVKKLTRDREPFERWLIEPEVFDNFFVRSSPSLKQDGVGQDIYHGKAILNIGDFLERCTAFEANTVLSHDHVESLMGYGQSTHLAKVYEPFPNSRSDWERRQHRWVRGDIQITPYLFGVRRIAGRRMSSFERLGSFQIVLGSLIPIFQYLFIACNVAAGARYALCALAVLIATEQRGVLFAVVDVARRGDIRDDRAGFIRAAIHAISNSALMYAGLAVFLQRNFLITIDAVGVSVFRLINGRRGLLEWYPADGSIVIRRRRIAEALILVWCGILAYTGVSSTLLPVAALFWVLAPALIAVLSVRHFRG